MTVPYMYLPTISGSVSDCRTASGEVPTVISLLATNSPLMMQLR
ncbi:MAG: hypothetical protein WBA31_07530 [Candidatus Dormiibacterota bacterium]